MVAEVSSFISLEMVLQRRLLLPFWHPQNYFVFYTQIHQVWFGNMITSSWKGFECCATTSFQALWLSLSCFGYNLSYHTKKSQKFKVKEKEAVTDLSSEKSGIWIINKPHSNWRHFLTNWAIDFCLCLFWIIFHPLQQSSIMVK